MLLDDINQAEPAVIERLNPLLETPCIWTLTEKGDTKPLPVPQGFRLFATMTCPSGTSSGAP